MRIKLKMDYISPAGLIYKKGSEVNLFVKIAEFLIKSKAAKKIGGK